MNAAGTPASIAFHDPRMAQYNAPMRIIPNPAATATASTFRQAASSSLLLRNEGAYPYRSRNNRTPSRALPSPESVSPIDWFGNSPAKRRKRAVGFFLPLVVSRHLRYRHCVRGDCLFILEQFEVSREASAVDASCGTEERVLRCLPKNPNCRMPKRISTGVIPTGRRTNLTRQLPTTPRPSG